MMDDFQESPAPAPKKKLLNQTGEILSGISKGILQRDGSRGVQLPTVPLHKPPRTVDHPGFQDRYSSEPIISKFQNISYLKNMYPAVFASRLEQHRAELTHPETQLIHAFKNSLIELNELRYCMKQTGTDNDVNSSLDPKFVNLFQEKTPSHPCYYEDQTLRSSVALFLNLFGKEKEAEANRVFFRKSENYEECLYEQQGLLQSTAPQFHGKIMDLCDTEQKEALAPLVRLGLMSQFANFATAVYRDYNWSIYHPEYLPCQDLRKKIEHDAQEQFLFDSQHLDRLYDCKTRTKCRPELDQLQECILKNDSKVLKCKEPMVRLFDCAITKVLIQDTLDVKKIAKSL